MQTTQIVVFQNVNVVCFNYDPLLIQPIIVFCLHHIVIKRDSSPKNKDYHVIPDVYDFLSSGEHKQIFLVRLMQGDHTLETTRSEHDGQV